MQRQGEDKWQVAAVAGVQGCKRHKGAERESEKGIKRGEDCEGPRGSGSPEQGRRVEERHR